MEEGALVAKILEGHDLQNDEEYETVSKTIIDRYSSFLALDSLEARDRELMTIKFVSPEVGFGLFAKKFIKEGELVGHYTGVLQFEGENTDYAWVYKSSFIKGEKINLVIDSRLKGNYMRFANHRGPNCNVDTESLPYKNRWHLLYIARKDIQPGEEITTDYGDAYFETRN